MTSLEELCYSSQDEYNLVKGRIEALLAEAVKLRNKTPSLAQADDPYMETWLAMMNRELDSIIQDLIILRKDLEMWGPEEPVCWYEFHAKIYQLTMRIQNTRETLSELIKTMYKGRPRGYMSS